MGKISGIKILSQNEAQVGRQHRNRVPNEWRERLFPYSILIAIRSIPQRCALTDPIGGHIVNNSLSQNWDVNPEDVLQRGTKSCPFSLLTIYVSHDKNFKLAKRKTLLPPPSIHFLYSCLPSVTKGDLWSYLAWLNLCDSYLVGVNPSQLSNSLLMIFFFLCSALILNFKTRQTNRLH